MTKVVAITVASLLFRRHDVTVGGDPLTLITTRQDVLEHPWNNLSFDFSFVTDAIAQATDPYTPDEGYLTAYATLMRRIEIDKGDIHSVPAFPSPPEDHILRAAINEDEHELEWHYDPENIDDSFFKADTENVQVLAGAIDQVDFRRFYRGVLNGGSIGNISLSTSALIAVIFLETGANERTYLIIATREIQNTDQGYNDLGEGWFSFGDPAGNRGDPPVLVEGTDADIVLPFPGGQVQWWALDPTGVPVEPPLLIEDLGEDCRLHLSPDNHTLWYKLVVAI